MKRAWFEAATIALCLWVGLYHTPAGALLRSLGSAVFGLRGESRPLLSYYSGGVERGGSNTALIVSVAYVPSPAEALGLGARAAYAAMPEQARRGVAARLTGYGVRAGELEDAAAFTRTIKELMKTRRESEAMLALFVGETTAAFAQTRTFKDDLEALAQALPPGLETETTAAGRALSFARAYGLGWPLVNHARITSGFGWRTHPVSGERLFHKGVDLGTAIGTEVRAPAAGVVIRSSEDAYNGNIVVIEHGQGVRTLFLHNSERFVARGQRVEVGQPIGRSGNTGTSTGPHLHYQLELGAVPHDPTAFRSR